MFHHLTNSMLKLDSKEKLKEYIKKDDSRLEDVRLTISKHNWYRNKKEIQPNERCSCGRLAGFGIDVDGCLFLQYCCDGYINTWK